MSAIFKMSPCVAPWLRLQSNWQRILCAGQGSAGHASRDHATQSGFGPSADQCHGSVTWLHRFLSGSVGGCWFPYGCVTENVGYIPNYSHFIGIIMIINHWVQWQTHMFPWHSMTFHMAVPKIVLLECRMSDARDSTYLVSGRPGPRVVQNKSYVMTGGEHPICRVLPFFGQQRSLCDLGRIPGKRWGFHKEPGRDPNQLWHGVPTGTALENPASLGRYPMLCEC